MQSYLRRADRPVVAGLAFSLMFVCGAKAGSLSPDSDIVGIKTAMTSEQVKQIIQQQSGSAEFPPVTMKFGTPAYSRDVILGFVGNISSKADKDANQKQQEALKKENEARRAAGCNSPMCLAMPTGLVKDNLTVYVDPNAGSSVLALVRETAYPKNSDILATVFMQSLVDKFGKPSFVDQYGTSYWSDGAGPSSGADWSSCVRFGDYVADLQKNFAMAMNDFARNLVKPPKCSMYLKVNITRIGKPGLMSTDYVDSFRMALVNARASYAALSGYAAAFWAAANSAGQDKLSKESQNKPKL